MGLQLFHSQGFSIAPRFQWVSKIKVQIQLLFHVADLWVFCLIYVTPIEASKEIAAGSCTKGSHHVLTMLHQEGAIKAKWVSHLRIMRESCLAKSSLKQPPVHPSVSNQGAVMRDWYLNSGWLAEQKHQTKKGLDPVRHQKACFVAKTASLARKIGPFMSF